MLVSRYSSMNAYLTCIINNPRHKAYAFRIFFPIAKGTGQINSKYPLSFRLVYIFTYLFVQLHLLISGSSWARDPTSIAAAACATATVTISLLQYLKILAKPWYIREIDTTLLIYWNNYINTNIYSEKILGIKP